MKSHRFLHHELNQTFFILIDFLKFRVRFFFIYTLFKMTKLISKKNDVIIKHSFNSK
jgi:hypothetical protein